MIPLPLFIFDMALSYYAVSPYGLETLLADELHRLGAQRLPPQLLPPWAGSPVAGNLAPHGAGCAPAPRARSIAQCPLRPPGPMIAGAHPWNEL